MSFILAVFFRYSFVSLSRHTERGERACRCILPRPSRSWGTHWSYGGGRHNCIRKSMHYHYYYYYFLDSLVHIVKQKFIIFMLSFKYTSFTGLYCLRAVEAIRKLLHAYSARLRPPLLPSSTEREEPLLISLGSPVQQCLLHQGCWFTLETLIPWKTELFKISSQNVAQNKVLRNAILRIWTLFKGWAATK